MFEFLSFTHSNDVMPEYKHTEPILGKTNETLTSKFLNFFSKKITQT